MSITLHPELEKCETFAHLKLGRSAVSPPHPRTLTLSDYLTEALPTAPTKVVWGKGVKNYPMDGNDTLGDCTCAAFAHMLQTWCSESGKDATVTSADAILMYWMTGSPPSKTGVPGGPTDTGRMCTDVLAYGVDTGCGGDKIIAWAKVNLANHQERDAAHWLFGGLYLGVALPLTAQTQRVWATVKDDGSGYNQPGSWGGHCVPTVGRWTNRWEIITWGGRLEMTEDFFDTYVDEAYVCITQDWIDAQGVSPVPGVNLAQLQTDLGQL